MILFRRRRALVPQHWLSRVPPLLAALTASVAAPAFAADLAAPPAFTWTGFYLGANAGARVAPANPSYEAIGFRSAGFELVPYGGGTEQIEAGSNQLAGPVA